MPRKSKANRARANNLRSGRQKHQKHDTLPRDTAPEEAGMFLGADEPDPAIDLEWDTSSADSDFQTESEDDSDSGSEAVAEDDEEDLKNEADLAAFSARLQKNLADALAAEKREKELGKKRRATRYDRLSQRTAERKRANARVEAADDKRQGIRQISLVDMFRAKSRAESEVTAEPEEISDSESDLSANDGIAVDDTESSDREPDAEEPASQMVSAAMEELQVTLGDEILPAAEHPRDGAASGHQGHYRDIPRLKKAREQLTKLAKSPKLDVLFRARINQMASMLNLFLDEETSFTWRQASLVVAKAAHRKEATAESIRHWVHDYLETGKLPLHQYGRFSSSMLEDEDLSEQIQLHLLEIAKNGYIRAQDVVDYIARPEIQERLGSSGRKKTTIHLRTAQRWLNKMSWRYGKKQNGMYIDGHERDDVVAYRKEFIARWKEYERRMVQYDQDGNIATTPRGFPVEQGPRFRLYLVTHDESTFFQNDRRRKVWSHPSQGPMPQPKGEGESLMVSDFLSPDFGRLVYEDEEACIFFRAGKNRDGYFTNEDLLEQTLIAIEIFELKTNGQATALFIFDNARTHKKRAADALSASKMPKKPKLGWTHVKDGPKMRDGKLPDGTPHTLYFPEDHPTMPGWFKGMEVIIRERGLWPADGLRAACAKCPEDSTACCCRRVLFLQPDFIAQKSALEELIESRGHICDFYPKFHCELNFIEQYWGAAKFRYRVSPRTSDIAEMERIVRSCLDDVPLITIKRYSNRSARFISGYDQGLSGPEAAWANRKYHGHRVLPPDMIAEVKKSLTSI